MRRLAAALLATAVAACNPGGSGELASPDPARRAAAVERLSDPRDARQLAALLAAQQDVHPGVRAAAARALGARGGARALEALASMLSDPDPEVVGAAARALATIRADAPPGDAAAAAQLSEAAGRALAQAYGRADQRSRVEIAQAMRALGAPLRDAVDAEARQTWEQAMRAWRGASPAGRAGAAEELARSGRAEAVRMLVPVLEAPDGDPRVQAAVARGLGASGDRTVQEPLAEALGSRHAVVAEAAAWALGNLADVQAADALANASTSGPARVARAAVAALDALPPAPGVAVALCEVALRAREPDVAESAAAGAAGRGADCPERPLLQRIGRGGTDAVAGLAALGALRLPLERLRPPAEKAVALLGSSGESRVRVAAARALGSAPFPPAVPALQKRLSAIQERAARAKTPAGAAAPLADSGDAEELAEVAVALARLAPAASGPLSTRLAEAADARLRAAGARSLSAARQPGAAEALARLSADPDLDVRTAAYAGLGSLGDTGIAPLEAALRARGDDAGEGHAIVDALGETRDASVLRVLAPLLPGPLGTAAARAIGRIGSLAGVAPLVAALQVSGTPARLEVVEALAVLGSADAGEALSLELLSDRPPVRAASARALGKLRYEPAAGRLEALRSDYFAEVRRAALEALARLPGRAPSRKP